jgi:hypothetical protein
MENDMAEKQYIICTKRKDNGSFSMSAKPHVHGTFAEAEEEAKRLALLDTNKTFIVVEVCAAIRANESPFIRTRTV